ncbi:hypothetical protein, partial [Komagataeibacter sp. NFXK3]
SSRRYCARVISVQAILISSGYRKPMNHNPLKSLNSFSVRHLEEPSFSFASRLEFHYFDSLGMSPEFPL